MTEPVRVPEIPKSNSVDRTKRPTVVTGCLIPMVAVALIVIGLVL